MFKRPHHQRIQKLLEAFDAEFLLANGCYFGGGTAIVLTLGEYRESVDVDFVCGTREGYKTIRNTVIPSSLGRLLTAPVKLLRDVRADQFGVRTFLEIDGTPIKFELISENRIEVGGSISPCLKVPVLSCADLQAEKLLANADRGLDRSTHSRDIVDLAMTIIGWGPLANNVWEKVKDSYGDHVVEQFYKVRDMVSDNEYLGSCLAAMSMESALAPKIQEALWRQQGEANSAMDPEPVTLLQ
jgi:hypothetical protein